MKRGAVALQIPLLIIRLLFIIAVLATLLAFINAHINAKITIFDAEADTLAARILSHPDIMLEDTSLQRLMPGVVDVVKCKKLTNDAFDRTISYQDAKSHIAGTFTVTGKNGVVCGAAFNKNRFDILDVQHQAGGAFGSGVKAKHVVMPVVLSDNGARSAGTMDIIIEQET